LAIDLVEPASFQKPIKNIGRFLICFNLLGLGEEELVSRLPREFIRVRRVRCLKRLVSVLDPLR
jgi:hypothetical protein